MPEEQKPSAAATPPLNEPPAAPEETPTPDSSSAPEEAALPEEAPEPEAASAPPAPEPVTILEPSPPFPTPPVIDRLEQVRMALDATPCALLRADIADNGLLTVSGTMTHQDDWQRLRQRLEALPASEKMALAVTVASPELCEPLTLIKPLRSANASRNAPLVVTPGYGEPVFLDQQELRLTIQAPDEGPIHLLVDYFTVNGAVVHLLPNPLEPIASLEAGAVRHLGERTGQTRFWTIGPPFGQELITVIASTAPLFTTPRLETEAMAAYLPELHHALDAIAANSPQPLATALFITTKSP